MAKVLMPNHAGSASGIPKFSYTGDYLLVGDGEKNWRVKFLTSGTLTFSKLGNAANGIDVFLVGGGGSGAAGNAYYGAGGGGGIDQ